MILAAIAAFLIDRQFFKAARWSLVAAAFTGIGLMHSFQVHGNDIDYLFNLDVLARLVDPAGQLGLSSPADDVLVYRAGPLVIGYLLLAAAFFAFGVYAARHPESESTEH